MLRNPFVVLDKAISAVNMTVRARKGRRALVEQLEVRRLLAVPTGIDLSPASIDENRPANTIVGQLTQTGDTDAGDSWTYALVPGADDNASFDIDSRGRLVATSPFDFEVRNAYTVRVEVQDELLGTFQQSLPVDVRNVNEAPTGVALDTQSIVENAPVGTLIGTASVLGDPDADDSWTYSIVGTGSTRFTIDPESGELRTAAIFDFEAGATATEVVRATDAGGLSADTTFTVDIADRGLSLTNFQIEENSPLGFVVADIGTMDDWAPSGTVSYSLRTGAGDDDNDAFRIENNQLLLNAPVDFEREPALRSVRIRATDSTGRFREEQFTIRIVDLNDAPTDIILSNTSVPENQQAGYVVGFFRAVDQSPAPGEVEWHTFDLVSGAVDNKLFEIVEVTDSPEDTRRYELRTTQPLDYEDKNELTIRVTVTDRAGEQYTNDIQINVTDTGELDFELSSAWIPENSPVAGALVGFLKKINTAGDVTFSLVSGVADNAKFRIPAGSNRLEAAEVFDYEVNRTYTIRVEAITSSSRLEKTFTIAVTDTNDRPYDIQLALAPAQVNPPIGALIGTLSTADQDQQNAGSTMAGPYVYSLVGGDPGNEFFNIVENRLVTKRSFANEPNRSYQIRIRVTDQSMGSGTDPNFFEKVFVVRPKNEAPTDIALSGPFSVTENAAIGTVVGAFSTIDVNAGDFFGYTLVAGPGDSDNASFTIDSSGNLQTAGAFDFETKNSYNIRVRATDTTDALWCEKSFTIGVTDVFEAPTDITLSNARIEEERPAGLEIGTLGTLDVDWGDAFSYRLVAGDGDASNALFHLDGDRLLTSQTFNRQTNNSYTIRVRSTDLGGLYAEKTFTLSLYEAATDISLSSASVAENQPVNTLVGVLSSLDADGDTVHVYTLVQEAGGNDNALFQIVGNELRTNATFDYEMKNSFTVRVRSTDPHGLWFEKRFTIGVTNVNDAPTDILPASASVQENLPAGALVARLSAVDQDNFGDFTYLLVSGVGSDDNAMFEIANGELRTKQPLNYEAKSNYTVRVRATDVGGQSVEKAITISVIDVEDTLPEFILANNRLAENSPTGALVGVLKTMDPARLVVFTLVDGAGSADNALFAINAQGQLVSLQALNFEEAATRTVRIRATDLDGVYVEKSFLIRITNANDTPSEIIFTREPLVENPVIGALAGTLATMDEDAGETFTYSLVGGFGGEDNSFYRINGNRLEVASSLAGEPDRSFAVRVRSTDSKGAYVEKTLVLNPSNAPTDITLSNSVIAEDVAAGTVVGDFAMLPPDAADTYSYVLLDDAAYPYNAMFDIVDGQLVTKGSFNFEAQTSYAIQVQVTDGASNSFSKVFTIGVTDVNEVPTDIALSNAAVAENQPAGTLVGTISATDEDAGDSFTYAFAAGGTDNSEFAIVGDELCTASGFNFETNSSYSIRVRATDAGGLFYEKDFTIAVTDVFEAPTDITLSNARIEEERPAGLEIGTLGTLDVDWGDAFSYRLVAGDGDASNALFHLDGDRLLTSQTFNRQTNNSYTIRVRSTDLGGLYAEKTFTLSLYEAATDISLSSASVAENQPVNTLVGVLSSLDADGDTVHVYTLVQEAGGNDNALFQIVGNELRTNATFDYEMKNSFTVRVRSTDPHGLWFEKRFTIGVTNVNDAPTDILPASASVQENLPAGALVARLSAVDQDNFGDFTYLLVSGVGSDDNAMFEIANGELRTKQPLNYEAKSNYTVRVRATDVGGQSVEKAITISVIDVEDTLPEFILANNRLAENSPTGALVGVLKTMDPARLVVFTLVDGAGSADNALFAINAQGQLVSLQALNFEEAATRTVRIRATDLDGVYVEKSFLIRITNANDTPSEIIFTREPLVENPVIGALAGTLATMDEDAGETFTYSLVGGFGGEDNSFYRINGNRLEVASSLAGEPDRSFAVRVRSTDSKGAYVEKTLVLNPSNAPTDIFLTGSSVAENQPVGTFVGYVAATDLDPDETFTYELFDNAVYPSNALFAIDGQGRLTTSAMLDFEAGATRQINVRVTDSGGWMFTKPLTITVNNLNEAPTDIALSNLTVVENQVGAVVGDLSATLPPGAVGPVSFMLFDSTAYPENDAFDIVNGQLVTKLPLDFEGQKTYTVQVRATAGDERFDKALTISVTNDLDLPTDITLSASTVAENQTAGTVVGILGMAHADANDAPVTYVLLDEVTYPDNALFDIVNGQLVTKQSFDFEGARNSYTIQVQVADSAGNPFAKELTVNVTNVNEAPTGVQLDTNSVAENAPIGTLVGRVAGVGDPDAGDSWTYQIVGGDSTSFTVDPVTGVLRTAAMFDFETARSYSVMVRATDAGGLSAEQAFAISVTDVNEAPTNITLFPALVRENMPVGTVVGMLQGIDPDAGDTATVSLVQSPSYPDNQYFIINPDGSLATLATFNYEVKRSYSIRVMATDSQGLTFAKTLTVSVTDANDTPQIIRLTNTDILLDSQPGYVVSEVQVSDEDPGDSFTTSLVAGEGDDDNYLFEVDYLKLKIKQPLPTDQTSFSILIGVTDSRGASTSRQFTLSVPASAPTDISLSGDTILDGSPVGSAVGTLTTTDASLGDVWTYSFVGGLGSDDNNLFAIVGDQLRTASAVDIADGATYSVRIRTMDSLGQSFSKAFTIVVTPMAAPVRLIVEPPAVLTEEPLVKEEPAPASPLTPLLVAPAPAVINGTEGDDVIVIAKVGDQYVYTINGTPSYANVSEVSSITINALGGNDIVTILPDVIGVTVNAGAGDDSVAGGTGDDLIYGGDGNDTLLGAQGLDTIYGNFGNDVILGGSQRDLIYGGLGDDEINGNEGPDMIYAGNGVDLVRGGLGADYIEGRGKTDNIYGGEGNDTILGGAGADAIFGGSGDDVLYANRSELFGDYIDGGDGTDSYEADADDTLSNVEVDLLI